MGSTSWPKFQKMFKMTCDSLKNYDKCDTRHNILATRLLEHDNINKKTIVKNSKLMSISNLW